ncbi:MAG: alpha/beta hydrolase-fold protein [Nitriliruptorales bacterium]|nr:alpha/beta hydrolase-fold protein [Nitriliruptorales bacterium]
MGDEQLATIASSEVFDVTSQHTGDDYRIFVGLPASYGTDPNALFPGIFVLDGNSAFPVITAIARQLQLASVLPQFGPGIPPAVVIGIGYPLDGDIWDASRLETGQQRRTHDYCSFVDPVMRRAHSARGIELQTGGSDVFLDVLVEELVPLVEDRFRLDPEDRTLRGGSLAGHFALYALFQRPGVFHRIAATSPAMRNLFEIEARYAESFDDLPARLFLGIGEEEQPSQLSDRDVIGEGVSVWEFYRFAALLRDRNYPNLRIRTKVYEGRSHLDVGAPAAVDSLLWLFSDDDHSMSRHA